LRFFLFFSFGRILFSDFLSSAPFFVLGARRGRPESRARWVFFFFFFVVFVFVVFFSLTEYGGLVPPLPPFRFSIRYISSPSSSQQCEKNENKAKKRRKKTRFPEREKKIKNNQTKKIFRSSSSSSSSSSSVPHPPLTLSPPPCLLVLVKSRPECTVPREFKGGKRGESQRRGEVREVEVEREEA